MTARQQFAGAIHAARVFRMYADRRPSERVFWLTSALDSYQTARRMRDRILGAA